MAGEGTPIAYFDPRLGFAARQIRIPGLTETRGMATLANGLDVVVGRPRDLMILGLGVASAKTVSLGVLAGGTVLASAPDGLVVFHGDAVHVDRLDQMVIEARRARLSAIGFLAVAGHRDQRQRLSIEVGSQPSCEFIAVHDRQTDVDQAELRQKLLCDAQSARAVGAEPRLVAEHV